MTRKGTGRWSLQWSRFWSHHFRRDQCTFLQREWAAVFEAASKAEAAAQTDPRTACFYARRALELAVGWAFKHDAGLRLPYRDNLSALIHQPSFKQRPARRSSARHA